MKGKSLVIQLLTLAIQVVGAYGALFSQAAGAWLGIVAFAATVLLNSDMLSTGVFPKNWTSVMWITNIGGIVIQILNEVMVKGLAPTDVVNYVITGINIFLFTFVKDYGNGTVLGKYKNA